LFIPDKTMADNFKEDKIIPEAGAEIQPESTGSETEQQPEKEAVLEKQPQPARESAPAPQDTSLRRRPKIRPALATMPTVKDELTVKIEKVMEEGINDAYQRLSPVAKQEFKLKGEETAIKIRELLRSAHVRAKKVLRLILEWLKMLPGINKFFLEQEAKIKTDRIISLQNKNIL
jgi:hypothetical protein